jgi:hypothetical protein
MEIYTSEASYIVRQDFMRFTTPEPRIRRTGRKELPVTKKDQAASLERLREAVAKDDGLGSYGSYKCPIF